MKNQTPLKKSPLSFRPKEGIKQKLIKLEKVLNLNPSEIINISIAELYKSKVTTTEEPFSKIQKSGLIGIAKDNSDLSENYKKYLTESFKQKI